MTTQKPQPPSIANVTSSGSTDYESLLSTVPDEVGLVSEIAQRVAMKAGGKALLNLAGLGAFAHIWEEAEKIQDRLRASKGEALVARLAARIGDVEKTATYLSNFVRDPHGSVLFSKIAAILDDNPPDEALCDHLSAALARILEDDWTKLFEEHRFMLDLIRQLSPQALTVLANNAAWPTFALNSFQSQGGMVTSPWHDEFAIAYGKPSGLEGTALGHLSYVIRDLAQKNLIQLRDSRIALRPTPTPMGGTLCRYLDPKRAL